MFSNSFETQIIFLYYLPKLRLSFKDLNSTVAKKGSVFIGLMTSDGAIRFIYQRAVLMR